MTDINLKDEHNEQLIKLITDEDIEAIEEELEFKIFKLAKSLKQKKITKSQAKQPKPVPPPVEEEFEFKIFKLPKSLKRKKITKSPGYQSKPVSQPVVQASNPQKEVTVYFYRIDYRTNVEFTFPVDTSTSVDHLIKQLTAKEIVS